MYDALMAWIMKTIIWKPQTMSLQFDKLSDDIKTEPQLE